MSKSEALRRIVNAASVIEEAEAVARRLARRHVPLGTEEAAAAARLFNVTGRRRGSFQDCVVAASQTVAMPPEPSSRSRV